MALRVKNNKLYCNESAQGFCVPKISHLVLNLIYSLFLFGAFLYGLIALNQYLHTNESFLSYFNDGLSIFEFLNAAIYSIVTESKISEMLPLIINNFNADVFSEVTTVLIFISVIVFVSVLFFTFVFNAIYIVYAKKMDKCCIYFLDENGNEYSLQERSLNKGIQVINIMYSVVTYLSILITELAVVFTTIMAGLSLARGFFDDEDDIDLAVKAGKILIVIGFMVLFFVGTALIVKKGERIAATRQYIYYENLGTYLKGILAALIPIFTIAAIAVLIFLIVLSLISIGARSDD